ncbi:MAG: TolC family protein [Flavobacteriales bacterium]
MNINKQVIIIVCFGFLNLSLFAQETTPITKDEVLTKVLENNTSIKINQEEFAISKADFNQTQAIFLPHIKASYSGIHTTNPLMAFGSKLNQETLTPQDFDPNLLNNPDEVTNFATKIEVQQPILNVDGIYQRKAAKTKMKATKLQIQRTQEYLSFEVEKAYMQLQLAHKSVAVLEKALKTANANKKLATDSFQQGFLQKTDVLSVEVRVNEVKNQLQQAKSKVQNASDYLSFLMNKPFGNIYQPTEELLKKEELQNGIIELPSNRADIHAMQLASDAYKSLNKADKMSFLPRLNAFGSYELYDDKIFQADANGYLLGAQLSWDLFEGGKRFRKTQKSTAQSQKTSLEYQQYISKSKLELHQAKRMLIDAKNQLDLTKLALDQSKEALRIRTNRFKEGLEKTTDLLNVETQFAQKQLEYYQTIYQYNYALAYLQFLTKQ